ncbi:MAG: CYTH domain-containing protein [Candidatus Dormibacteraeota bacterium]|uniref:CYTH domain-containing protein n=1 Tax=Candidatus Aeolococcus gillhamiae TaxID=3127015 RepID=A0A2W5Z458_9BACT|nr:CYTH domain-containing protein [Candidatus Dormibacteraeota bacterium]PZR77665.1 MAG: hypothetical protein DLM65_15140 [Candidatus Dormibacter sp. RRmetagenome_bin12]
MTDAPGASGPAAEEREVKLAITEDFVLPSMTALEGVSVVDQGDNHLHAVYWDSDDLDLAHTGVGLRHRNGVWTYKGRSRREGDAVVREELEIEAGGERIPEAMRACVVQWIDPAMLHPVAELDTVRHQVDVADASGSVELVHDRVTVRDGARTVSRFAEVEVEHAADGQALADRMVALLLARGAVVDTTPKYLRALRALGHDPPEVST